MRRAAKVDTAHAAIVNALRGVGGVVIDLSGVGGGVPDLLVYSSRTGCYYLLEVKAARGRLTAAQGAWHAAHRSLPRVAIVRSVDEALNFVGYEQKGL